jgi:hypothetical protein
VDETTRDWTKLVGGVVLAIGMVLIFVRKDGDWAAFPLLLVLAVPCAVLLGLGTQGVGGAQGLSAWQSTYLVTGVLLLLLTLLQLAVVLGVDDPLDSAGTEVWVFTLTAAAAGYLAVNLDSRVNMLLGALAIAVAGLSLIDWIGSDPGVKTFRWVLIVEAVIFLAAAMNMREESPDHSNYLMDAAGVTAVLAGSLEYLTGGLTGFFGGLVGTESSGGGQGNFWEFFLLAVSLALIAHSGVSRNRGTGYIGFVGLLLFAFIVGASDSLGGWPIILTIVGALAVAASSVGGQVATSGSRRTPPPSGPAGAPPSPPPPPGAP